MRGKSPLNRYRGPCVVMMSFMTLNIASSDAWLPSLAPCTRVLTTSSGQDTEAARTPIQTTVLKYALCVCVCVRVCVYVAYLLVDQPKIFQIYYTGGQMNTLFSYQPACHVW